MKTVLTNDPEIAGNCLKENGVVVFPTETVYGIGASALCAEACNRVYQIKNRPRDNPFIVHLGDLNFIQKIAYVNDDSYWSVIHKFSPGPITYILSKKDPSVFSSGLATIGVRVPDLEITRNMLKTANLPIAAPSANLSGKPSITRFQDAVYVFNGLVDMILDGGDCKVGLESTVLDLSKKQTLLLRPGSISFEELQVYLPTLQKNNLDSKQSPISPGLKYKHYSPDCEVILLNDMTNVDANDSGQIGFCLTFKTTFDVQIRDNIEYMQKLYSFFIDCDRKKLKRAYCEYPKKDSYYDALMNRLLKACEN